MRQQMGLELVAARVRVAILRAQLQVATREPRGIVLAARVAVEARTERTQAQAQPVAMDYVS
jgi:hypothetical protein